jgi:hypothetical protein
VAGEERDRPAEEVNRTDAEIDTVSTELRAIL